MAVAARQTRKRGSNPFFQGSPGMCFEQHDLPPLSFSACFVFLVSSKFREALLAGARPVPGVPGASADLLAQPRAAAHGCLGGPDELDLRAARRKWRRVAACGFRLGGSSFWRLPPPPPVWGNPLKSFLKSPAQCLREV